MTRRRIVIVLLAMAVGVLLSGAVYHSPPNSRSTHEWTNLYPNGAAKIWCDYDSTFYGAGNNADTLNFYSVADVGSLFTPTVTTVSALTDTVTVFVFGPWTPENAGDFLRPMVLMPGEAATFERVWDSLQVATDSARLRIFVEGHPEW